MSKVSSQSSSSKNCCIFSQFLETLTGHGVSRVNYEVTRLSKLHEDARKCSKEFQQGDDTLLCRAWAWARYKFEIPGVFLFKSLKWK